MQKNIKILRTLYAENICKGLVLNQLKCVILQGIYEVRMPCINAKRRFKGARKMK